MLRVTVLLALGVVVTLCSQQASSELVNPKGEWGYFLPTDEETTNYFQEYIYHEVNGRSNMACPKGYFISSIVYSFVKQENMTVNHNRVDSDLYFVPDSTTVLEFENRLDAFLRDEVTEADRLPLADGAQQHGHFHTRELKEEENRTPQTDVKAGPNEDAQSQEEKIDQPAQNPPQRKPGEEAMINEARAQQGVPAPVLPPQQGNHEGLIPQGQIPPAGNMPALQHGELPPPVVPPEQMPNVAPGGYPPGHPMNHNPPDPEGIHWEKHELEMPGGPPPPNQFDSHRHTAAEILEEKYKTLKSHYSERVKYDFMHKLGPCKTIMHCLGHQACIFYLGNSFCQNDPNPGYRKIMKTLVRCERESHYDALVQHGFNKFGFKLVQEQLETLQGWSDVVQYLSVKSGSAFGLETIVRKPIPESIFHTSCHQNPKSAGFMGNCSNVPEPAETTAKKLWSIIGRVVQPACREDIINTYCAYQYSQAAQCIPPSALEKGVAQIDSSPVMSFSSLPYNTDWPDRTQHMTIMDDPHMSLIPARIGFLIMGHTSPDAMIQLLHVIHRPQHYYVIHIDSSVPEVRQELETLIGSWFPGINNIRVLTQERSFRTSWGSYEIIRAELEGMEELLRMGIWDYVVNLSGADLPIRSVDDLADHLAEYRGNSLIRIHGDLPINKTTDIGIKCAWHACHGHLYNVTFGRQPFEADIIGSSQWGTFHRDFVEMVVSRDRPKWLRDIQYFLQTSLIPDETYFGTIISHKESPFREKFLKRGLTFMSQFVGEDKDSLCRHREETDICGRGPGDFTGDQMGNVAQAAHAMFFARKFVYHLHDPVRGQVASMAEVDHYTQELWNSFPPKLGWELSVVVMEYLVSMGHADMKLIDISRLRVVPRQTARDPCCLEIKDTIAASLAMEYNFLLELNVRIGDKVKLVKSSLSTKTPYLHSCYPAGHIRMMHIGTRRDPGNPRLSANPNGLPVPYEPVGGDMFWIQVVIIFKNISRDCAATKPDNAQTYITWPNTNMKVLKELTFEATVVNPDNLELCKVDIGMQPSLYQPNAATTVFVRDLRCPELKQTSEGWWTIKIVQKNVENPVIYEKSILLLQDPLRQHSVEKYFTREFAYNTFMVNDAAFIENLIDTKYYPNIDPKNLRHKRNIKVEEYHENLKNIAQPHRMQFYSIIAVAIFLILFLYKCVPRSCFPKMCRLPLAKLIFIVIAILLIIQLVLPIIL